MSRPRKYHTAAQYRAAKQRYNAIHYQKHRKSIVKKRQKKYRRDQRRAEKIYIKERKKARESKVNERHGSKSFQKSPAGKALLKARDLKVHYMTLVHNDVPRQLKEIVQHYLGVVTGYVQWKTADPAEAARLHFETPHAKLTDILTGVEECSKIILNQCGPGEEWLESDGICQEIRCGISLFEDVICHSMEGPGVLREAHFGKKLKFYTYIR